MRHLKCLPMHEGTVTKIKEEENVWEMGTSTVSFLFVYVCCIQFIKPFVFLAAFRDFFPFRIIDAFEKVGRIPLPLDESVFNYTNHFRFGVQPTLIEYSIVISPLHSSNHPLHLITHNLVCFIYRFQVQSRLILSQYMYGIWILRLPWIWIGFNAIKFDTNNGNQSIRITNTLHCT